MKNLIEKAIRLRNPQFHFDEHLSNYALWHFCVQQGLSLLRGTSILLALRKPKMMLRGRQVRLFNTRQITWGRFLKLGDHVKLSALGKGQINLGNNVSLGAFSQLIISTTPNHLGQFISIGNNVGIGEFAYLGGAGGLTIGDDCIVGQYFSCHPENHLYENEVLPIRMQGVTRKGISIGRNCWIGSKVTILDGVTIGDGCVIAAGSVVNKSVPGNSVVGGVPARILKTMGQQASAVSIFTPVENVAI
jgi:acetyltransferase-like isoleucine patch superfamily enzyme